MLFSKYIDTVQSLIGKVRASFLGVLAFSWSFVFPVLPCLNLNPLEAFELVLGTAAWVPCEGKEFVKVLEIN